MKHPELVQAATDLLSESRCAEQWLPLYDSALSSAGDAKLKTLVWLLRNQDGAGNHLPVAA